MSPHGEQLDDMDDMIDRVAAAETFVPADSALARQAAQRVHTSRAPVAWWPQLAAVAVATIALIAVTIVRNAPVEPAIATAPRVEPAPIVESTQVTKPEPVSVPLTRMTSGPLVRREVTAPIIEDSRGVPQIEALATPQPLVVAELPVESLTIAPVDVAPIELRDLPLAEMDHRDTPKE